MTSLLLETATVLAAVVMSVLAAWNKLRCDRYRRRWREALGLHKEVSEASGVWSVQLHGLGRNATWVVTDGETVAAKIAADFEYQSLAPAARKNAERLAKDLNAGKFTVKA